MAGRTYFVVRAVIASSEDRAAFDHWYQTEHLPDAMKIFGATHAFRAWSRTDPAIHCAYYEFPTLLAAESIGDSDGIKGLITEFDAKWAGRVTRTREIFEVVDER